ncbi:MAG: hypothetical protein HQL06_08230 [Nitrospirae bacterium]|nr:hypothetical protein [Nitrospirota bacterium]
MMRGRASSLSTTLFVLAAIVSALMFAALPVSAWQKYSPAAQGQTTLSALTDITVTAPSDNQTLQYNAASGKWINVTPVSGGGAGYTDAQARAAMSCSVAGLTYNSATGITSLTSGYVIPTASEETNWNTAYSHIGLINNPHSVTKTQVGLGSVENTALSTWTGSGNITTVGPLSNLTVGSTIKLGTTDAYSRGQIWNYMPNSVLRLGSLQPDGDPTGNITSEGIIVYNTKDGAAMTSVANGDAFNNYGYARIKGNRFGLYSVDTSGLNDYYFRVDPTSLYLRKDNGSKSFEVMRATGVLTGATWQGSAIGDSYISSAANWNTAYSHSSATGNPHSAALDNLTNINISSPSNGQVIKYDSGTSKWVNAAESGGGATALSGLTDVAVSSLSNGQYLTYNSGTSRWVNSTLPSYVATTTTVNGHALSDNITVTASDVGLGNVSNTAQVTSVGATAPITSSGGTTECAHRKQV